MRIGIYCESKLKEEIIKFYKGRPGFTIDNDSPQILHFFDVNVKALKGLIKKKKPDLVISHFRSFFTEIKYPEVFWPLHSKTDIFTSPSVLTNSPALCRLYFARLGLQKIINSIMKKKSVLENDSNQTSKFSLWDRICQIMRWK